MRENTQFTVENRRNWKGEIFDYDAIKAYELHECQYCLTDAQIAVLGGLIESLGWATRWQSDTQLIDEVWVRDFKSDIARRLMVSCCNDDLIYTYDEDGNLQSSDDGGVTWNDDPTGDIRINPKVILPPITSSTGVDKKCSAADGMINILKEQIGDQLTDDMSRYTLSQLIHDWTTTMIGTSNPFEALVTVIANQIFALVISAVRAAINDTTYDDLKCIFYCNMEDDGSFSESEWGTVRTQITDKITGIAGVFFEHLVYLLGNGGLTNLARAGAGATDANCNSCNCGCSVYDFTTLSADGWAALTNDCGTYGELTSDGWKSTFFNGSVCGNTFNSLMDAYVRRTMTGNINRVEVEVNTVSGGQVYVMSNSGAITINHGTVTSGIQTFVWDDPTGFDLVTNLNVECFAGPVGSGDYAYIRRITVCFSE